MIIMSYAKGMFVYKGHNSISTRNDVVHIPVGPLPC